jgi:hypothetical protein
MKNQDDKVFMKNRVSQLLKRHSTAFDCAIILALSVFAYSGIITHSGAVSRIDFDYGFPIYNFKNWADLWIERNYYVWDHYAWTGVSSTANTFLPMALLSKLFSFILSADQFKIFLLIFSTALAGWSMYWLVKSSILKKNTSKQRLACMISSAIYMFNPFIYNRILFGGPYFIAYALAPIVMSLFIQSLDKLPKYKSRDIIFLAFTFSATIFIERLTAYMLLIAVMVYFAFYLVFKVAKPNSNRLNCLIKSIFTVTVVIGIAMGLNAYWLFPSVLSPAEVLISKPSSDALMAASENSYIINTFRLRGDPYGYFTLMDSALPNPLQTVLSFILPIFSFAAILFRPKDKKVLFFSTIALISIVMSSGIKGPLDGLYTWFYLNLPYFFVFKESTKFLFLTSLAFAFLIGTMMYSLLNMFTLNYRQIRKSLKTFYRNSFSLRSLFKNAIVCFLFILILFSVVANTWPAYTQMSQQFPNINIPNDYYEVHDLLSNDEGDFRVLLLPMSTTLKTDWISSSVPYIHNPLFMTPPNKPVIGNPEGSSPAIQTTLLAYFQNIIYDRNALQFNQLLTLLSVKYIVVPKDNEVGNSLPPSGSREWYFIAYGWEGFWLPPEIVMDFLNSNPELKLVYDGPSLAMFKYKDSTSLHLYSVSTSYLTGDNLVPLELLPYAENDKFLLIPSSSLNPSNYPRMFSEIQGILIRDENDLIDIFFSISSESFVAKAYQHANNSYYPENGWVQGYFPVISSPYSTGDIPTDGKFAYTWKSGATLEVPFNVEHNNNYDIWLKVGFGSQQGEILIKVDNKTESTLTTKKDEQFAFGWFKIDKVNLEQGTHNLIIENTLGQGYVDKIAIASSQWFAGNFTKWVNTVQDKIINYTNSPPDLVELAKPPAITFKKVNPTKYEVKVENATQPFFLIFDENYDSQWKAYIEDKEPEFNGAIGGYLQMNVKKANHEESFTPEDTSYLFTKLLDENYHFIANGYANAWYINKTGTFTMTLEFWPQNLFYQGLAISITTLILCTIYISKDKIKIIYQKYLKKKQRSSVNHKMTNNAKP